jgi:hypothetical protein
MAAIPAINGNVNGSFAAAITTLSADDTITYDSTKKQLLVLTNTTGGSLTATIDGDGVSTVNFPGAPGLNLASGYAIAVPAGESRAVVLSSISAYLTGVVHITGASTLKVQLINL